MSSAAAAAGILIKPGPAVHWYKGNGTFSRETLACSVELGSSQVGMYVANFFTTLQQVQ